MPELSTEYELLAREIVDAAFAVHSSLDPGLLESVYEHCLAAELRLRNITVERQIPVPVIYSGERLDAGFRIDLLIGGLVAVEVKATETTLPIHEAQLVTYLKLSSYRLGLLINFNVRLIRDGIRRRINSG